MAFISHVTQQQVRKTTGKSENQLVYDKPLSKQKNILAWNPVKINFHY